MSKKTSRQKAPALRAAFTRQLPERGVERHEQREPMTDAELKAWSDERTPRLGKTSMIFIQGINRSVPYEQYTQFLSAGGYANRDAAWDAINKVPKPEIHETSEAIGAVATEQAVAV